MVKLVYKLVSPLVSVVGGLVAGAAFKQLWKLVAHDRDAPTATDEDRGWLEVLAAASLQGAVFAFVKAVLERSGALGIKRATGKWPAGSEAR